MSMMMVIRFFCIVRDLAQVCGCGEVDIIGYGENYLFYNYYNMHDYYNDHDARLEL